MLSRCSASSRRAGHKLILLTMRSEKYLQDAVDFCMERSNWAVNNPREMPRTSSPKVYAQLYIDDMALGVPMNTGRGLVCGLTAAVEGLWIHPTSMSFHAKEVLMAKTSQQAGIWPQDEQTGLQRHTARRASAFHAHPEQAQEVRHPAQPVFHPMALQEGLHQADEQAPQGNPPTLTRFYHPKRIARQLESLPVERLLEEWKEWRGY